MSHKDALRLLFPLELGGVFDADIEAEGAILDATQERAEDLLTEMRPDAATETITGWERIYGLVPASDATLQSRRDNVVRKIRERGGLSRQYFIALAAALGYTITIDELRPLMCGWDRCGAALAAGTAWFIWRVNVPGYAVYQARAGVTVSGERLLWWRPQEALETIFNRLKPAHTHVIFDYS